MQYSTYLFSRSVIMIWYTSMYKTLSTTQCLLMIPVDIIELASLLVCHDSCGYNYYSQLAYQFVMTCSQDSLSLLLNYLFWSCFSTGFLELLFLLLYMLNPQLLVGRHIIYIWKFKNVLEQHGKPGHVMFDRSILFFMYIYIYPQINEFAAGLIPMSSTPDDYI